MYSQFTAPLVPICHQWLKMTLTDQSMKAVVDESKLSQLRPPVLIIHSLSSSANTGNNHVKHRLCVRPVWSASALDLLSCIQLSYMQSRPTYPPTSWEGELGHDFPPHHSATCHPYKLPLATSPQHHLASGHPHLPPLLTATRTSPPPDGFKVGG